MTRRTHLAHHTTSKITTLLTGWPLLAARLVWFLLTGLVLLLLVLIALRNPTSHLNDRLIGRSYQSFSTFFNYQQFISYVVFIRFLVTGIFVVVGVLIFRLKSNDWLAGLTSISLICLPYSAFFGVLFGELRIYYPTFWANPLEIANRMVLSSSAMSTIFLLFVFPDGRFVPRFLRIPVKVTFLAFLTGIFLPQSLLSSLIDVGWVIFTGILMILFLAGIYGQIYRYLRISTPAHRLQTKWIVYSILLNLVWFIFVAFELENYMRLTAASIYSLFELLASVVIIAMIPVSVAFSILRFRLWDIDLIIRRTLVYSLLTGALSVLYFSSVALLQGLLTGGDRPLTAVSSPPSAVAIVVTTLVIAALANPLRRRIQNAIDRRFYRQKYDAERALAAFAASARNETDLQVLAGSMVGVIQSTLQPQTLSVWFSSNITEGKS